MLGSHVYGKNVISTAHSFGALKYISEGLQIGKKMLFRLKSIMKNVEIDFTFNSSWISNSFWQPVAGNATLIFMLN